MLKKNRISTFTSKEDFEKVPAANKQDWTRELPLASDWKQVVCQEHKKPYYYHVTTLCVGGLVGSETVGKITFH